MSRPAAACSLKCPLGVWPNQGQSLYAYLGTSIWRSPSSLQFLSISVYSGCTTLNSLSSFRFSYYLLSAPEYLKFWLSPQVTSCGPSELLPFQTACWGQLSVLTHQTENTHTYIPKSRTIDVFCSWTYSTPIIFTAANIWHDLKLHHHRISSNSGSVEDKKIWFWVSLTSMQSVLLENSLSYSLNRQLLEGHISF